MMGGADEKGIFGDLYMLEIGMASLDMVCIK